MASRGDEQNFFHCGAGDEPGDERSASGGNLGSSEWEYRTLAFPLLPNTSLKIHENLLSR